MASVARHFRSKPAAQNRCASLVGKLHRSGKAKLKRYRSGAFLFREGEPADGVYVLCKGRVKISVSSSEGKILALRIAKAGDLLGVCAGLTARPCEATAQMIDDGLIEFIPREAFAELMRSQPLFAVQLLQMITDEFFEFMEHARLLLLSQSSRCADVTMLTSVSIFMVARSPSCPFTCATKTANGFDCACTTDKEELIRPTNHTYSFNSPYLHTVFR